jgi:transcriptional regulator with XRE-family HTH domain
MSKIYESIKAIRTAKNLKQEEVAQKLGMAQSNYARMEKGLTQITVDRLEELAGVFEMSVSSILSYEIGQVQPTTEDIDYYISLCKKYEKQLNTLKKRVEELEEAELEGWGQKDDEVKGLKLKNKELIEKIKEKDKTIEGKERTIKILEKAIEALSK